MIPTAFLHGLPDSGEFCLHWGSKWQPSQHGWRLTGDVSQPFRMEERAFVHHTNTKSPAWDALHVLQCLKLPLCESMQEERLSYFCSQHQEYPTFLKVLFREFSESHFNLRDMKRVWSLSVFMCMWLGEFCLQVCVRYGTVSLLMFVVFVSGSNDLTHTQCWSAEH